jgi:uncharacterized metal-binding protein
MSIENFTRIVGKFVRDLFAYILLYLDRNINLNTVMFDIAAHIDIRKVTVLLAYRPFKIQREIFVVLSITVGHTAHYVSDEVYRFTLKTNSHMPCRAPVILRQCLVLRENPRGSRKYPKC